MSASESASKSTEAKQTAALASAKQFLEHANWDDPNLTGEIWRRISGDGKDRAALASDTTKLAENWTHASVAELQRQLVNYQLHQMRRGNAPRVFSEYQRAMRWVAQRCGTMTLLDVGCSSGYYLEVLRAAQLPVDYRGCDYNQDSVALARKLYPSTAFDVADVTKLGYRDRAFQVCVLSGVIEHVPAYEAALRQVCRVTDRYLVLHRIYLSDAATSCTTGLQYFVPVCRYTYNAADFFKLLRDNGFVEVHRSSEYDNHCRTYVLERVTKAPPN